MPEVVTQFTGPYRFLSNFFKAETWFEGTAYPTSEHAFQAAKTLNLAERLMVRNRPSASSAKRAGRTVTLRGDWEEVKTRVMYQVCLSKFLRPALRTRLLDTGSAKLIEGNYWHDTFWGVCTCEDCSEGRNELGKVLMVVRRDLRDVRYTQSLAEGEWIKTVGGRELYEL